MGMASINMEENLASSLLEDNKSVRLIRGSVPGADMLFGSFLFLKQPFCSLCCDPVTYCVKLFSGHFCSEEVEELKLVLGLDLFSVPQSICVPSSTSPFPKLFPP